MSLAVALPLTSAVAFSAELSPLQLKTMQTRKFNKPFSEVLDAIKVSGEDNNGTCATEIAQLLELGLKKSAEAFCGFNKIPAPDPYAKVPIIGTIRALRDLSAQETDIGMIKYQVTVSKPDETIIRMRILGRDGQTPILKPEIYALEFKRLADALFVQAIEINPALQE